MFKLAFAAATFCAIAATARPVDRYTVQWATPPGPAGGFAVPTGRPGPPAAPYAGNGDISVMYTGGEPAPPHGRDSALSWQQWLYLSKNDMWGSDSVAVRSTRTTPARPTYLQINKP
jgi:hypothetical protein